ncbi:MAG: hypothetical protein EBZ69_00675 [Alphaproteobacteria bacterium]|nr:hypothetical protein [Alphaproteobacteria bacterium]
MAQERIFPFRRVSVDHMVRGVTRVWWQLESVFNDPGPYIFQLQFGRTGLRDAADWKNVGEPVENAYVALDPTFRAIGYDLTTHYRVVLTTPNKTYISQASNCFGELTEKDWLFAREIIRKEKLRQNIVSAPGYLLKPMRYGKLCKLCRDPLTQELTDANCPQCLGTGFEVGFHPPLPMQCWDLSPQTISEQVDSQLKGATRDNPYVTARVIGFPALNKSDIWVNGSSDERWLVDTIQVIAAIRNVPIVYSIKMGLLPLNNSIYALEVGGEEPARTGPTLPMEGCGSVIVDHDYLGPDSLVYETGDGCKVTGADIYVFTKALFDAHGTDIDRELATAKTTTRVNGRWSYSLKLDVGDYVLLYEKPGEYGPDTTLLNVEEPPEGTLPVWTQPTTPQTQNRGIPKLKVQRTASNSGQPKSANDFWTI